MLSHRIPCGDLSHRPEVQKLLAKLGTLPIGQALKIGFLRSLMRARYAVEPLGHYGLAKTKYTHFTSPIRRYADLVVHRVLFDKVDTPVPALKQIADRITETEKNSSDAERDSKEVKLYAYLEAQLASGSPTAYPALVTDTRNFGFFVDVPDLGLSGVVPLSSIQDDFYMLDTARNHLIGRHTHRVIKLGDKVTVQIYKLDRFKKQVDFELTRERSSSASSDSREEGSRRGRSSARSGDRRNDDRRDQPRRDEQRPARTSDSRPPQPGRGKAPARSGDRPSGDRDQRPRSSKDAESQRPSLGSAAAEQSSGRGSPSAKNASKRIGDAADKSRDRNSPRGSRSSEPREEQSPRRGRSSTKKSEPAAPDAEEKPQKWYQRLFGKAKPKPKAAAPAKKKKS